VSRQLSKVNKDGYLRISLKSARYKPNLKDESTGTQPILIKATEQQKQAAENSNHHPLFSLTALPAGEEDGGWAVESIKTESMECRFEPVLS